MVTSKTIDKLPNLDDVVYGDTIGEGGFAVIKSAVLKGSQTLIAIKFINKDLAYKKGQQESAKKEYMLHKHCNPHPNVIKFLGHGSDPQYHWIAMEYAMGGDLFDKIEPDIGLEEDVAHLYFRQLISAVDFLHSKGVAHRDIKPENIFLDGDGNLKLGDFGLATLFRKPTSGARRQCSTVCGSPPYVSPEVLKGTYEADKADIWSCGVVLFVLLSGMTPWDEPLLEDRDFRSYAKADDKSLLFQWSGVPSDALSLLKGTLKINPKERFNIDMIRQHLWFRRPNKLMSVGQRGNGDRCKDPIDLASRLLKGLRVDVHRPSTARKKRSLNNSTNPKTPAKNNSNTRHPLTQASPAVDNLLPFAASQPIRGGSFASPGQPVFSQPLADRTRSDKLGADDYALAMISADPIQMQFMKNKLAQLPLSLTQQANQFKDLIPAGRFTRFYSRIPVESLISGICDELNRIGAQVPRVDPMIALMENDGEATVPFSISDRRKMTMHGQVKFSAVSEGFIKIDFIKKKGDPLEWRCMFKRVVVACNEYVYVESDEDDDD